MRTHTHNTVTVTPFDPPRAVEGGFSVKENGGASSPGAGAPPVLRPGPPWPPSAVRSPSASNLQTLVYTIIIIRGSLLASASLLTEEWLGEEVAALPLLQCSLV